MGPKNIYGKRPVAQHSLLAAQIFTASSSPAKPSPPRMLRETPERRRRNKFIVPQPVEDEEIEDVVGELTGLHLGAGDGAVEEGAADCGAVATAQQVPQRQTDRHEYGQGGRSALGIRDANTVSKTPPRGKRAKKVDDQRKSNASASPDASSHQSKQNVDKAAHRPSLQDFQVSRATAPHIDDAGQHRAKPRRRQAPQATGPKASPSPLPADVLTDYAQPLLNLSSDPDPKLSSFASWSTSLNRYFRITKIAEASFGEVYRLSLLRPISHLCKADESVLKIIALKPPSSAGPFTAAQRKRHAAMSDIEDVANEIRLLKHLTPIPGFTNFRDIKVVRGRLPKEFVAAWKAFNKSIKPSEFPDPSRKGAHSEDQLWAVVEMQDAGLDVESCIEKGGDVSVQAVWDVFWSVAGAIAKAEEYCGFEHRDLHLGNICIRPRADPSSSQSHAPRDYPQDQEQQHQSYNILNPSQTNTPSSGLETTIIDYTLSRACVGERDDIAFFDLSRDGAIFEGDAAEEYQYDIYRFMRAAVLSGDPAALVPIADSTAGSKNGRGRKAKPTHTYFDSEGTARVKPTEPMDGRTQSEKWRRHHPLTNLVWLHFVLAQLADAMERTLLLRGEPGPMTPERKLLGRLRRLGRLLEIKGLAGSGVGSVAGLVAWAVGRGWLGVGDVLGIDEGLIDDFEALGIGDVKEVSRRRKGERSGTVEEDLYRAERRGIGDIHD